MSASSTRLVARRRGLTLMELVVVMAILIALAAIIVPLMPGLLGRAERASRATNSQEIYKTIQLFQSMYSHYPTDFDALTDGSSGVAYVSGFSGSTAPLTTSTLSSTQLAALNSAGVTRVQKLLAGSAPLPAPNDATFNPYPSTDREADGATVSSASSFNFAILTNEGQRQLNLSDNATESSGTYVVFGLGKRCSIVGTGMNEAPMNFFDNAALSPDTRYSRYGVVFQVSGISPTNAAAGATGPITDFLHAKFVRVFRFGGALGTGDDAIRDYWRDVAQGDGN
jgi:type II secretory pathway pseudopilin PulG